MHRTGKSSAKASCRGRITFNLPPQLAEWLLERIERGVFLDPREAVFVLLGEHVDLEPHIDLRQELLRRSLDAAINDSRPSIPAEQVLIELREKMAAPLPEPAVWTPRVPP
jgi:antitoxin ParD1/3/4